MGRQMLSGAALLLAAGTAIPAAAQVPAVEVTVPVKNDRAATDSDAIAAMMGELFKAEPLNPEQEARLPLARQVVEAMTPDGFYTDVMDEMMGGMMQPLFDTIGDSAILEEALERQVGLAPEDQPELSEQQRMQVLALLDPAAKERAAAIMAGTTKLMRELGRQIEPPFREGMSKAFAVRFSETELADIRRFFTTPSGATFARQSVALYSDPQVMSAMMSIMPAALEGIPQMVEGVEQATANLPKRRRYADLTRPQQQQLAQILGMSERDLRRSMARAEEEQSAAGQDK